MGAQLESGRIRLLLGLMALIAVSLVQPRAAMAVAPAAAVFGVIVAWHERILSWRSLTLILIAGIFFVPIRTYGFRVSLPFELEPFRVLVLVIAALWATALLVQPGERLRRSGLELPLGVLGIVIVVSIVLNMSSIAEQDLGSEIAKKLTFWLSFLIFFYFIVSTVTAEQVEGIVKWIVTFAAILGLFAVYESKTGTNEFARLDQYIPILERIAAPLDTFRAGMNRVYASAQHPIAFGAMMSTVLPFAIVYAYRRRTFYWFAACLFIAVGALAAISRTSVVMIVAGGVVLAALRPKEAKRLWPLALPLLIAIQLVLPGTLSTMVQEFFPKEGLIGQQANQQVGSGRVASLGPAFSEISRHPLFGKGFGARITDTTSPKRNAFILDNEWVSSMDEIGFIGVFVWAWVFLRFCRRTARASKEDDSETSWLMAAFSASVASFAVGMGFFDAFSFIQVTVITFVYMALGCVLLRDGTAYGRMRQLGRESRGRSSAPRDRDWWMDVIAEPRPWRNR